jgi:hypothetical protein
MFTARAHLELPPEAFQAVFAPFKCEPPKGLDMQAQGMSFYSRTSDYVDTALTLDRSVAVEGLYFQLRSSFDSRSHDLSSGFDSFLSLMEKAIEATNLGGAF